MIRASTILALAVAGAFASASAFASIRDRLKGKTLIIVDNTPISVQHADMVIFMGGGKVLDVGTHSELMDRNPGYVEMYRNMVC